MRSPEELIEKLAALVPPPNLVRYHGVLVPHAADRSLIVPGAETEPETAADCPGHEATVGRRYRLLWGKLLAGFFAST